MRGYHVGGRSLLWGRQSYRFSELDWEANARDGVAVDWPVSSADMSPWYDYVERFAGISGTPRRSAATARRPVPTADGDELPRETGEGSHRQGVRRAADDHRTRGEPDAAAQRPRRLPVPQPLHSRLPVRRLLQQQRRHVARRLRHRQADAPAVLDRDRAHLRSPTPSAPPACASSTRRRTRRPSTSRASSFSARPRSRRRSSCSTRCRIGSRMASATTAASWATT